MTVTNCPKHTSLKQGANQNLHVLVTTESHSSIYNVPKYVTFYH